MSEINSPRRTCIWGAMKSAFKPCARKMIPWVVPVAIAQFTMVFYDARSGLYDKPVHVGTYSNILLWVSLAVVYAASYGCNFVCLQQFPVVSAPRFSIKNVLLYVFYALLMLLFIAPLFLQVVLVMGIFNAGAMYPSQGQGDVVLKGFFVLAIAMIPFSLVSTYVIVRLTGIIQLVVSGVQKPMRMAWRIAKGHWWRLFGYTCILYMLVPIDFMFMRLLSLFKGDVNDPSLVVIVGIAAVRVAVDTFYVMLAPIFCNAVCRVLYQEKKAVDPAFDLVVNH